MGKYDDRTREELVARAGGVVSDSYPKRLVNGVFEPDRG